MISMKQICKKVAAAFKRWKTEISDMYTAYRRRILWQELIEGIQPLEFDGELYLAYNGIPLMNVRHMQCAQATDDFDKLTVLIELARETAYMYRVGIEQPMPIIEQQ